MTITRLTLVRDAPTSATRRAAFPLDESLDQVALRETTRLAPRLGHVDAAWCGPASSSRETAQALGLTPMIASELDEWDVGTWRGRTIAELHAADPGAVSEWVQEPAAAPHGGESLLDLLARVGRWLDARAQDRQRIVAVTNGAVIKASLIRALQAPPEAVWRLDVAPLSRTVMHAYEGRWTVRATNVAPDHSPGG